MKKLFYSLFILATTAMTFCSCEDVPSPFDFPTKGSETPGATIDPAGSGTQADPYNVAAAINFTQQLEMGEESSNDVYIKGKVVSIRENYTTQYGNASFTISDDGTNKGTFLVYRALYLGNKKYTSGDLLQEGDEVIVCGKVTNYNGTLETQQNKAFLYSLNGKSEGGGGDTGGEAKGSGTLDDPYNPAGAAAAVKNLTWTSNDVYDTTGDVYVKGKISRIADKGTFTEGGTYGNASFYISEDGKESGEFYCFRVLYLGNKKFEAGQTDIKVGDEVVIYGQLMNYRNDTPETVAGKAYLYSLNGKTEDGGGGDTPGPGDNTGAGSYTSPYSVSAAQAAGTGTGVYVKAYIVGSIDGQVYASGAVFGTTGTQKTNILIAASADETNVDNCMPVQLPSGAVRNAINLQDNPGNYKKEVLLYGNIEKYFGVVGLKSVTYAEIGGSSVGSKP